MRVSVIKKKYQRYALMVICLTLLLSIVIYMSARYSEPYEAAERFIRKNHLLKEVIGQINKMRLAPLGYAFHYGGVSGRAEFEVIIVGEKTDASVFIKLVKEVGTWQVIRARLKLADGDFLELMNVSAVQ